MWLGTNFPLKRFQKGDKLVESNGSSPTILRDKVHNAEADSDPKEVLVLLDGLMSVINSWGQPRAFKIFWTLVYKEILDFSLFWKTTFVTNLLPALNEFV